MPEWKGFSLTDPSSWVPVNGNYGGPGWTAGERITDDNAEPNRDIKPALNSFGQPSQVDALCKIKFITIIMFLFFFVLWGGCVNMTNKEVEAGKISNISFSNDGKKILFDRGGPYDIHVYDLETEELSAYNAYDAIRGREKQWSMARYSYNGKKIVFITIAVVDKYLDLKNMQIAVMGIDGKNVREITNSPGTRMGPSFSHDGRKVIFARADTVRDRGKTPAAGYDVYEVDVKTGKETRLTYFRFFQMSDPYYFPDDKTFIVWAEYPSQYPGALDNDDYDVIKKKREEYKSKYEENNIFVMKGGEETLEPFIVFGTHSGKPLITADGKRIFFNRQILLEKGGYRYPYYEYSQDGDHRKITDNLFIVSAAISPDGKLLGIVYDGYENYPGTGKHKIAIYNTKDGTRRDISLPDIPSRIINKHLEKP